MHVCCVELFVDAKIIIYPSAPHQAMRASIAAVPNATAAPTDDAAEGFGAVSGSVVSGSVLHVGVTALAFRGSDAPSSHAFQCGHAVSEGLPCATRSALPYIVLRSLQATPMHENVPSTAAMTAWKPSATIPAGYVT